MIRELAIDDDFLGAYPTTPMRIAAGRNGYLDSCRILIVSRQTNSCLISILIVALGANTASVRVS